MKERQTEAIMRGFQTIEEGQLKGFETLEKSLEIQTQALERVKGNTSS